MATPQRQVRASGFTQLGRQRRPLIARDFERYARSVAAFIRLAIKPHWRFPAVFGHDDGDHGTRCKGENTDDVASRFEKAS
jgi:hypothetical protein